jgi:hypothetical protein
MSFPAEAPSTHPPGLKLGVFAGGGPFPRLVAPGIVVGNPAYLGAGDPSYKQMGLTHVLTRSEGAAVCPQDGSVVLLVIGEQQTLREVVELLVYTRSAAPRGCILVGEPYVTTAYLMAIEGRDLNTTWRLVTGECLTRKVLRQVHGVLTQFAKDVEEEGKKLAKEEERQQQQQQQPRQPLAPHKRGRKQDVRAVPSP